MNSRIKTLDSVLVKPAGPDCNMACTYCFYLGKSGLFPDVKTHRMSEEILEVMIRQVLSQSQKQVSFSWQGGEPTLMGLPFFKNAVEFQMKHGRGHVVGNGLQTNGLLIDGRWAEFLKEYRFLVGLSIDGPEHIHDHYRFMQNGKGTWSSVVDKAKLLLDSGVEVNALAVLNDYSVRFPEEIYGYFKSIGLNYMQFIPCVEMDPNNPQQSAPFSVLPEQYGQFLCKMFDLWITDFTGNLPSTSIRFFESVFFHYAGLTPPECTLLQECGVYVVVEHNGDVYSCDFFVVPYWKLGNVMKDDLRTLLNSEKQREFGRMKSALSMECQSCQWLRACRGGCTKDRFHNPGDKTSNYLCPSFKMFFQHADTRLKKLAEEWKKQQTFASMHRQAAVESEPLPLKKIGRNAPCPCGSGEKYKKCCGRDF
jgi:uncharacterized protein